MSVYVCGRCGARKGERTKSGKGGKISQSCRVHREKKQFKWGANAR